MSATSSNALKALIEGLGLGLMAYRDEAPQGTARPYVTIQEQVVMVPDSLEDGAVSTVVETASVDLWQDYKNLTAGTVAESYTLAPALERGLHGKRLNAIGTAVTYAVLVRSMIRFVEVENNIVHHAIEVDIFREL